MAKQQQNIDNFFRNRLSDYEAPGKKGDWQLMNQLLDARQRRRTLLRRLFFVASFLLVAVFGVLIMNRAAEKNTTVAGKINMEHSAAKAPAIIKNSEPKPAVQANDNNATAGQANNSTQEGTKADINKTADKNASQQKPIKNYGLVAAAAVKPNGEKVSPSGTTNEGNVSKTDKDVSAESANEKPIEKTKTGEEDINIGASTKPDNNDVVIATSAAAQPLMNDSAVTASAAQAAATDSSGQSSSAAQTSGNDSTITDSPAAQVPDSLHNVSMKDSIRASRKGSRLGLNLFAGLNLYRTQSADLADERSVSALLGMEIMHTLSKHFEIGVGTWYSLQSGYNLSDTATQVSYFLEENVSQQVILVHKQHRLYIPLTVYYLISDKHAISGGVHWSYLINTVGDYYVTNTGSDGTTQSHQEDVKGYMDGIESSAFSFAVGYRYSLSRRFDISMRFVQELSDSYTPEYFYGVNTSPTWSMQTFISIKF